MAADKVSSTQTAQLVKQRWREGRQPLFGIFTRLTSPEAYEALALSQSDLIVIDAEHGSFDRGDLNRCIGAARSGGLAVLVRLADAGLSGVQHAINAGAHGIVIPHVSGPAEIARVIDFSRGLAVERAWAGAGRASGFRSSAWSEFSGAAPQYLQVIAQIDEPPGVATAQEIAAVPGLDGIFLGGIGFSLAVKASHSGAAAVQEALAVVCAAARDHDVPLGMSLPNAAEVADWAACGVRMFVIDSDYAILRNGLNQRVAEFRRALLENTTQ